MYWFYADYIGLIEKKMGNMHPGTPQLPEVLGDFEEVRFPAIGV